jgi:hypothetical protein
VSRDLGAGHQQRHAARENGAKRCAGPLGLARPGGVDLETGFAAAGRRRLVVRLGNRVRAQVQVQVRHGRPPGRVSAAPRFRFVPPESFQVFI